MLRSFGSVDVAYTRNIYEPWLVALRVALDFSTLVFVIGKVLILDRAYLASDVPVGITRATVLDPESAVNVSRHGYCRGDVKCTVYDSYDMVHRGGGTSWVVLKTAQTETTQVRDCAGGTCGASWTTVASHSARVAGVEDFRIQVEHVYQSPKFFQEWVDDNPMESNTANPWWASHASLSGYLVTHENTVLKHFAPKEPDVVTLHDILSAAGIDLRETAGVSDSDGRLLTVRDTGVVLFVTIALHNRPLAHAVNTDAALMRLGKASVLVPGVDDVYYTYRAVRLPTSVFSSTDIVSRNHTHRILETTTGVQICFVHTGEILTASPSLLIVTLTAAITLMQFSAGIVNHLASKITSRSASHPHTSDAELSTPPNRSRVHAIGNSPMLRDAGKPWSFKL